jgi:hypothetical protein
MNDHDPLDTLLRDAATHWRVPERVPTDSMWDAIHSATTRPAQASRPRGWFAWGGAVAAALLVGVALGRSMAPTAAVTTDAADVQLATSVVDPYQRTTEELLGQTAVLLVGLPNGLVPAATNDQLVTQGVDLLRTTRLLLDSPVARDPRMLHLLEDLELILAQVAGLEPRRSEELTLIHDAVTERDLVPRLRSAVVSLSTHVN